MGMNDGRGWPQSMAVPEGMVELMTRRARPLPPGRLVITTNARPAGWSVMACLPDPTPPIGTPGAAAHGGNSTPALAPVAGVWKSPVFGPDSGE